MIEIFNDSPPPHLFKKEIQEKIDSDPDFRRKYRKIRRTLEQNGIVFPK